MDNRVIGISGSGSLRRVVMGLVLFGKPIAELVPKSSARQKPLLGATPSPYAIPPDIDDPVDVEWETMK